MLKVKDLSPPRNRDRDVLRKEKKLYWKKRNAHWEVRLSSILGQNLNHKTSSILGRREYIKILSKPQSIIKIKSLVYVDLSSLFGWLCVGDVIFRTCD